MSRFVASRNANTHGACSPGVSGIGAVYAQKLVQKYGAIESILETALADKARFPLRVLFVYVSADAGTGGAGAPWRAAAQGPRLCVAVQAAGASERARRAGR